MESDKKTIEEQRKYIVEAQECINKLNKKLKTWLISFLILLIITMIIAFWYMFGGAGGCLNDPFNYGANAIAKKLDGNIKCECVFYGNKEEKNLVGVYQKKIVRFSFSNEGFNKISFGIDPYDFALGGKNATIKM